MNNKQSKIEWAASKMMELASNNDAAGIDRVNNWAYDFARGSNARKNELEIAHQAAVAACA